MIKLFVLGILLLNTGLPTMVYGNSSIDNTQIECCKIHELVRIYNSNTFNDEEVATLFKTINPKCKNNAEFMQFSNELLFLSLEHNHDAFLLSYKASLNKDFILEMLENPISDEIDLRALIEILYKSESSAKDEIIRRLEVALEKYQKE